MKSQTERYTKKQYEELMGWTTPRLAQVADDMSHVETLQQTQFTGKDNPEYNLPRYKIRIFGIHGDDIAPAALPWAYPPFPTSGLRGESVGEPRFPINTLVYVIKQIDTGNWYIDRVAPNSKGKLSQKKQGKGPQIASGFQPGSTLFMRPKTQYGSDVQGETVSQRPKGETQQNKDKRKEGDSPILFSWVDNLEDAAEGVQNDLEKLIKDIEEGIDDFEEAINEYAKKISKWITKMMNRVKKLFIRKLEAVINNALAVNPLSGRFAANGIKKKIIDAIACIFKLMISNLGNLIGNAITSFIDKIVNVATCVVENFIGNFIGQIVGQLSGLINGILGPVSNLFGSIGSLMGSIGSVLKTILSLLECEVGGCIKTDEGPGEAKQEGESLMDYKKRRDKEKKCDSGEDPEVKRWNFNEGGAPKNKSLNIKDIFDKARQVGEDFEALTNVPDNLRNFNFDFNPGSAISDVLTDCYSGPEICGAPQVVFWGGNGSGAAGNAVVNATGDLLGIDIILPGNYSEAPFVSLRDNCGNGGGFTGEAVIGGVGIATTTFGDGTGIGTTGGLSDLSDPTYDDTNVGTGAGLGVGAIFNIKVKGTPAGNKYVVDGRQQRTLTLERGKTYIFDQQHFSNGPVGLATTNISLGDTLYTVEQQAQAGKVHPLRFSEKSDGIWNCDRTNETTSPDPWLLAKDGLSPDDWVLSTDGWSPFLQNYGVYPSYEVLPGTHVGNWEVEIQETGDYTFEMQADNVGTITWDGVFLGSTDAYAGVAVDLKGPHNTPKFLSVNVTQTGKHTITASIENTPHSDTTAPRDWDRNPGALAWVLRDSSGNIVASSIDPFAPQTEEIITNCGVEYTRGVTVDGVPGQIGAYTRIVVNNNTPDTLYYYCNQHSGMGGLINVVTPDAQTVNMHCRDATVEISEVDGNGKVIAIRNLQGGTGYSAGSTNLITQGGNGTDFTLNVDAVNEGTITLLSINNGGRGYVPGEVVNIICRPSKPTSTTTGIGVTQVIVKETGFGYLSKPDGSQGGMRRTWAGRCQTTVHRANGNWDVPYSEGDIITLYPDDSIKLPSKPEIYIDEDFDASMLPGCIIVGGSPTAKDMSNFPFGGKTDFTFSDIDYLNFIREVYDWEGGYGIERIDGTDPSYPAGVAQWWFYADGEYLGTFIQEEFTQVPQFKIDGILYRLGEYKEGVSTTIEQDTSEWLLAKNGTSANNWVLTDPQGWSPFLQTYGVYPSYDVSINTPHRGEWEVEITEPGTYTFEVQADNQGSINFDGSFLGSTTIFDSHNSSTFFTVDNVTTGTHTITGTITNVDNSYSEWERNPAAFAFVLRGPSGNIVRTSLDPFANTTQRIDEPTKSRFSIKMYEVITQEVGDISLGDDTRFFGFKEYTKAQRMGFSDYDIRTFLEVNSATGSATSDIIILDDFMKSRLANPNWGATPDYSVSYTAPGCPDDGGGECTVDADCPEGYVCLNGVCVPVGQCRVDADCPPNHICMDGVCVPESTDTVSGGEIGGTYPVIACIDTIYALNPGFGFDCSKDTISIVPENGAKAVIEECDENGGILKIKIINCGSGYNEIPDVFINTDTGYNAMLYPVMKFHRPDIETPEGTNVLQVIDCVGNVGSLRRTRI